MKNTIPKKIPLLFSRPKKILAFFIDRKNPFWPKCQTQKNPLDPPVIKICEWGPWDDNGGDAVGSDDENGSDGGSIDGDIGSDDNRVFKCDVIKN